MTERVDRYGMTPFYLSCQRRLIRNFQDQRFLPYQIF